MKSRPINALALLVLGITLVTACPAVAQDLMHARVSYEDGGVTVRGADDADWSFATINTLILPGDTLWVDKSGILEVEMSGGSFLRMADASKAEIASLPPSTVVLGWTGAFYIQRVSRSTGDLVFKAPAAAVEISRDSQVRIDIVANGATTVTVRWGRADVRTDVGGAVAVTQGERTFIDPGFLPSSPIPFDRSEQDDFDTWNRERAQALALGDDAFPPSVGADTLPMGSADLAKYGEWVTLGGTPHWRPTVIREYVPYRHGYWSYVPAAGHVWVDHYPFGYMTSHYGRWTHHNHYGWLWTYQPIWGPAWVAAIYHGPHLIWAPLDPFGRPVIIGGTHFTFAGVGFSVMASSYCFASDLTYGPSVVHGVYVDLFRRIHPHNVHIWNFCGPHGPHGVRPFSGSRAHIRDLSPRRVIRGHDFGGPGHGPARARVAVLEGNMSRTRFATVSTTGARRTRTPAVASVRNARARSVAVHKPARADRRTAEPRSAPSLARVTRSGGASSSESSRSSPRVSSVRSVPIRGNSPPPRSIATLRSSGPSRSDSVRSSPTPTRSRSISSVTLAPLSRSLSAPRLSTRSIPSTRPAPSSRSYATRSVGTSLGRATPSSAPRLRSPAATSRSVSTPATPSYSRISSGRSSRAAAPSTSRGTGSVSTGRSFRSMASRGRR